MSIFESSTSWTRPEIADADAPTRTGDAVSFLLTRGLDLRRESRRITVGFLALIVLGVIALNVGIYETARGKLVREGWEHLTANTDARREQLLTILDHLRRESRSIAELPVVEAQVARAQAGEYGPEDRAALETELRRAASTLAFTNVQLIDVEGQILAAAAPADPAGHANDLGLVRRADVEQEVLFGDPEAHALVIAVPFRTPAVAGGRVVLLAHSDDERFIAPLLTRFPGSGVSSGAYLVRQDGERFLTLTSLSPGTSDGVRAGARGSLSNVGVVAPAMAATGVESYAETRHPNGAVTWSVTRFLPEVGWGLVGQAQESVLLAGLRSTITGLLLLDLAMVLCALALAWLWRRQYATGLAHRELEVTQRHATRVQAIFDTAFDAILTFDRSGLVRTANRAALTMFGREPGELDGEPIQRFLHWNSDPRTAYALPAPGTVWVGEAMREGSASIPVEFSLGHAGEGDERMFTAIVRDISERVESEERIRAFAEGLENTNRRLEEVNAQLEEASRLKSEFLANTSHELRTPLNGMIGFLQLVLDGMCDNPEEERDYLKQSLQCSRHLLGLINDVLDIAKIEAGKLTLEVEPIEVQQLFDEVYTLTHVQAAQKGIGLAFVNDLKDGVAARGDFGKIKQVLINLVGNSLKFTARGHIEVRAQAHEELGHLMFEVMDTGIGIPRDRQRLIFEKFTQGDGSTTRRYGGTGLGLAISRSLVELMGGIIGVESEGEGKGTRLYFSLPLWRTEPAATPEEEQATTEQIKGPTGGQLVLVVEDDSVFRRFLTAVLQQHGFRTLEADHAELGWMLARRMKPSVVVLDYALSCADGASLRTGWDLAERMTTDALTRHIPLVFVTGFDVEVREKLKSTAFSRRPEHLVKPIEAQVLVSKIEGLIGTVSGRQVRVLMADDDPSVAAYVRKVLPESRFHLEVANNGEECLHILRTQPKGFDVLLLDLMMPEVSGYDVLREMTLTGTHTELPVLVLTNFPEARNEEERRLLEQGLVLDVVAKTAVHENPHLLPHVLDWHLQVARAALEVEQAADPDARREAA